jgi:excisionase family DNA binding protein
MKTHDGIPPVALSVAAAAQYSALSRSRLYLLMKNRELPSIRVGGRRLIRRDALDAYFQRLETEG